MKIDDLYDLPESYDDSWRQDWSLKDEHELQKAWDAVRREEDLKDMDEIETNSFPYQWEEDWSEK